MEKISHTNDFTGLFSDKRLEKRADQISHRLLMSRSSVIHSATQNEAEQKGFYRFLQNENVTESVLINELTRRCAKNVFARDIIVIQDTTSFGLNHNTKNIKKDSGVGYVGNKVGIGFLGHCSIVLDAHQETMLGFSNIQLWHRTEDKANNTTKAYKKQPIEEKESFKWIRASEESKQLLEGAKSITIIEDREGDIYEQFSLIPDEKTHLLIRNRDNRKLDNGGKLHDVLNSSPALGQYNLQLYGDLRLGKIKREATVQVKVVAVEIKRPEKLLRKELPSKLKVYAVEVKEINNDGQDRICWRILTTKETSTIKDAIEVVEMYKLRWYVEQLFRLLKKQGFKIEETQLESGWAIRKLVILILNSALRVMQLYLAYDTDESQGIKEVFDEQEIECLQMIERRRFKETPKVKNPFPADKLSWATWLIARLGGWKGNAKQRKPGPILLKRGLEKFTMIYEGWKLAKDLI